MVRGRVLATLQADAVLVLENTANRLGDIDPGSAYAELHQVVLDYFPAAAAVWMAFDADPATGDPLLYGAIVADLEAERAVTGALLAAQHVSVLKAMPDSKITAGTDVWFAPPPPEDPVE